MGLSVHYLGTYITGGGRRKPGASLRPAPILENCWHSPAIMK